MNSPIYKDYFYTAETPSLEYYIVADGNIIFSGKAWRNPDTGLIKIGVGDIIRDYMSFDLPDFRLLDDVVTRQADAYKVFELYDASGAKMDEYKVLFDWTGEWNGETKVLSNPANPVIDPRMKIVWSVYNPTDTDIEMEWYPHVRNTYFKLLDDPIYVSYYGGTYEIRWRTNYYPYEDIDLSTLFPGVIFGESTDTGTTAYFPPSDSPSPRTYSIDASYGGQSLGDTHAIQSIFFNLITKYIDVSKAGGTYPVFWETEVHPENLKIIVIGADGVEISEVTQSGCTITFPPNGLYRENEITIEYYFAVEGEDDYYLDSTEITSAARYIDQDVSRDVYIACDGTFAAFNTPGIQIWNGMTTCSEGYWPVANEQFDMTLFNKNSVAGFPPQRFSLSNNIPLCRKTVKCENIYGEYGTTWDIGNYVASANTSWINGCIVEGRDHVCGKWCPSITLPITGNPAPGELTIYIDGEAMDTNIVIKLPQNSITPYFLSSVTPYQYSDFKFKSTGYTESVVRNVLTSGIPVYSQFHVYDGVKTVEDLGTVAIERYTSVYSPSAFNFETDADGWTTVKTPLPITQICTLYGLPATEIWISKNVKKMNIRNTDITAVTYEGTRLEFRNVLVWYATSAILRTNGIQCSDGISYGMSQNYDNWQYGKSDPVVFKGNTIMPASCGNIYDYDMEDIDPGRTVTITYTGSTYYGDMFSGCFYGFHGKMLTPVSIVTGMSEDNHATVTLTFNEDVYYLRDIWPEWRSISDVFRYVYTNSTNLGGSNLATPLTKMRAIRSYFMNGNPPYGTLEFNNLRAIIGSDNFSGVGNIQNFRAPNLVYLAKNSLWDAPITNLYIPSAQYIYGSSIPMTCTALTIGKNISYCDEWAMSGCTNLTEVTFEGTIADWGKMNFLQAEARFGAEYAFKLHTNVDTIHCLDGDVSLR